MIDAILIKRVPFPSVRIGEINRAWYQYVYEIKQNIKRLPFDGEYTVRVEGNHIFVLGYTGDLVIKKLFYNHRMFSLTTPIEQKDYKIYGVYTSTGEYCGLTSHPLIGVHYLGEGEWGIPICTGNVYSSIPKTIEGLKRNCVEVFRSLAMIHLHSIGKVILPEEHVLLKRCLERESGRFDALVAEGLIKPY